MKPRQENCYANWNTSLDNHYSPKELRFPGRLCRLPDPVNAAYFLTLWLVLPFVLQAAPSDAVVDPVSRYRKSPVAFHRALREAFTTRQDVSAEIRAVRKRTGDGSFDSLLVYSARKHNAFQEQAAAWEAWDRRDYPLALKRYARAADQFLQEGAHSEAAFSLYYIAEICAEQEDFSQSLRWLDHAAELIASTKCSYLEALIFQSQGYCLWFLDHLQTSAHSFSLALERWLEITYQPGITTSWSNLASLYEELRLWKRAQHCYEKALDSLEASTYAEIRFYLHVNYALFSHRQQDSSRAAYHLDEARRLRAVSPDQFLILECQVSGAPNCAERLISLHPQLPSLQVEKALLLGRHFRAKANKTQSYLYFQEALAHSRRHGLSHSVRESALELGSWLEADGQYQEAARLYFKTFNEKQNLFAPEFALPYSRAVSPLFDGWIRCLIRLGRTEQAWNEIQRLTWLRQQKAKGFQKRGLQIEFIADELAQFAAAGKLDTEPAPISRWESLPRTQQPTPNQFTILEMWPDGERVFVWIIQSSGRQFRELRFNRQVSEVVGAVVEPLYASTTSLPPAPRSRQLQELYNRLVRPVERLLNWDAVLFIGHKELQSLPLEMLQNEREEYLLQHYNVSYLPSVQHPAVRDRQVHTKPLFLGPDSFPLLPQVQKERFFFQSLFPDLKVLKAIETDSLLTARWVHISTHFRLDDRFWWASGFGHGTSEINLFRFLNNPLSTSLLSLGVCNAGNSYSSDSPHWLGLSELFLSRGVGAMVVSRWRLDELSSRIYRDFYALCKQGVPMDQALSRARRSFLGKTLRRGNGKVRGDHPFFWAGILYIGLPGTKLYPDPPPDRTLLLLSTNVCLLALSITGIKMTLMWLKKDQPIVPLKEVAANDPILGKKI